jgi:hypothetical protein
MIDTLRQACTGLTAFGLVALASGYHAAGQGETKRVRPGLTAQQTRQAVDLAKGTMRELRKKTEGATRPGADPREYIVAVELLALKESPPVPEVTKDKAPDPEKPPGPRAVVTSYRYFDDMTVFSIVDLGTGRVVDVEAALHIRTPLSDAEFEEAAAMVREQSGPVQQLYERFGDQVSVYPQFSQFNLKGEPRVHRVVHLSYRVGKRELSYPRAQVDLTTREVRTPAPDGRVQGRQE